MWPFTKNPTQAEADAMRRAKDDLLRSATGERGFAEYSDGKETRVMCVLPDGSAFHRSLAEVRLIQAKDG